MRNLVLVSLSALILGFTLGGQPASAQIKAAPSDTTVQRPDGSVQTNDRSHEGTVTIDREWKAQPGKGRQELRARSFPTPLTVPRPQQRPASSLRHGNPL